MQAVFGNKKYVILYSIIIGLALILTYSYLRPLSLQDSTLSDETIYLQLSFLAHSFFGDELRNLGYPAFLYVVRLFTLDTFLGTWLDSVRFIQFTLHICTAFACVGVLNHMKSRSNRLNLLVFSCVALNPLLLTQTQNILTETTSTFLLCVAILLMLNLKPFKWLCAGFTFGLLILVRPFHLQHVITIMSVTALWIMIVNRERLLQLPAKTTSLSIVTFVIGISFPLVLQSYSNYRAFQEFTLEKPANDYWRDLHFERSQFSYKYETYIAGQPAQRYFYDNNRKDYITSQDDPTDIIGNTLNDIVGSMSFYPIKLIALFQNYDWSTYRQIPSFSLLHPATLLGYLHFLAFLYLIQNFLLSLPKLISQGFVSYPFIWFAIMIQVAAFWIVFIPETRFIIQVIPLIITLAIYRFSEDTNGKYAIATFIIASVLYIITYNRLLAVAPY